MLERANREVIIHSQGIYWKMVRPLFWRTIFPFTAYPSGLNVPSIFKLGGYQYPVNDETFANSTINYYSFTDVNDYKFGTLTGRLKEYLGMSLKKIELRVITDCNQFIDQSYPVYISFLDRTKYEYKQNRLSLPVFAKWCKTMFMSDKLLKLGAYFGDILVGVAVVACVDGVVCIKTNFTHSEYNRYRVTDFLYHWIRILSRDSKYVNMIYAGNYTSNPGVNRFKERRGAILVRSKAYYHVNPLFRLPLKYLAQDKMNKILGTIDRP